MEIKDRLYKSGGNFIDLQIIGSEDIPETHTIKGNVHQTIGNYDLAEHIGTGEIRFTLSLIFENQEKFYIFKNFVTSGEQMTLVLKNRRTFIVNVVSNISTPSNYLGFYTASVEFTTARDPSQTTDFDINIFTYNVKSSKTFFEKLKDFSDKVYSFIGNVNEKINSFTNTIDLAITSIASVAQALASSESILSTPLNTIKRSSQNIVDSISNITRSLENIKFIIKTAPSQIQEIFNNIKQATDLLFTVFDSDDEDYDLQTNITFACNVGNKILVTDFNDGIYGESVNAMDLKNQNETTKILFLSGILSGIEVNTGYIGNISKKDLDYIKNTFDDIFSYIINNNNISTDFRNEINLCKIRFYRSYKRVYDKAYNIYEYYSPQYTSLHKIVYSVNGNLDFFNETMQLNNLVSTGNIKGTIFVISNERS